MARKNNHRRLPSLKKSMVRQCIVVGLLIVVLAIMSLIETAHISDNIYKQLGQLQTELINTQQQYNDNLAWNNRLHYISFDANRFRIEFELLTINPDQSDKEIGNIIARFKQHYQSLDSFRVSRSQSASVEQLKRDLWTLEDIGIELLDTSSANARLQLFRDSIGTVEAIRGNPLSISTESNALSNALKRRIDRVIEQSQYDQQQLEILLQRQNFIVLAISCISFFIILAAFYILFRRLSERVGLLEQYAEDIANQDYKRPPFSSKDVIGRLGIRMWLMARAIRKGIVTLQKSTRKIEELAFYDTLTGLENRRLFNENLEKAVLLSRRHGEHYALLYLDLDFFKEINDSHGHYVGDNVLKQLANRLHQTLREEDSVARLGGDEFALLLRSDNTDVSDLARRILKVLRQPIIDNELELKISASIGIAILGTDADNVHDLMRYADMALYKAKASGRNTYHYFDEQIEAIALKRSRRLEQLASAIENDQLELFYQTQHDVADNRITGVEALIRWSLPGEGLVFPGEFIPLAEESGLILPLGKWVIERACRDGKVLNQLAGPLTISVNISTRQFEDPALLNQIVESCRVHQLPHELVELEITENLLLKDMESSVRILDNMIKKGFHISLDDFGTGYSSLFYLKTLPVTRIKIDKSFTAGLPMDRNDTAIVDSTIQLAHRLGLMVVAEGVETEEQISYLRQSGCNSAQGFLLGKPQPLETLLEVFRQKSISVQ